MLLWDKKYNNPTIPGFWEKTEILRTRYANVPPNLQFFLTPTVLRVIQLAYFVRSKGFIPNLIQDIA